MDCGLVVEQHPHGVDGTLRMLQNVVILDLLVILQVRFEPCHFDLEDNFGRTKKHVGAVFIIIIPIIITSNSGKFFCFGFIVGVGTFTIATAEFFWYMVRIIARAVLFRWFSPQIKNSTGVPS